MRRAAISVARSIHRPVRRIVVRSRAVAAAQSDGSVTFFTSTTRNIARQHARGSQVLLSSMQLRSFSIALASSLVASGAYWAYQGSPSSASPSPASLFAPPSQTMIGPPYERQPISFDSRALESIELPSDVPVIKEADAGVHILDSISPQQATIKLRRYEQSYFVERGRGVVRYDSAQLPSNNPIEDDHTEEWSLDSNGNDWMFWGVFDGHSGYSTSYMLRKWLVQFVGVELDNVYKANKSWPSADAIDNAIKKGFLKLDNKLVYEAAERAMKSQSKAMAAHRLRPALSGSCALLSFYDTQAKTLRVACTGDSRAVLGRRGDNGLWTATPLSVDQTGGTPEEADRLRKEHPNEPNVVRNGRILGGLEPSRAFGDAIYKWPRALSEKLERDFLGRGPRPHLLTPPYVTAEPVVTTTKIQPEKGDFVVMATDGLWEFLSNEEVVGLVGKWLEKQKPNNTASSGSWLTGWLPGSGSSAKLPVERLRLAPLAQPDSGNAKDILGQRAPIREANNRASDEERFVVEDNNVATHLVRNALGGKNTDKLCALLTLAHPSSRRYRDDMTVEVIFFGEAPETGTITVNKEASGITNPRL